MLLTNSIIKLPFFVNNNWLGGLFIKVGINIRM